MARKSRAEPRFEKSETNSKHRSVQFSSGAMRSADLRSQRDDELSAQANDQLRLSTPAFESKLISPLMKKKKKDLLSARRI